MKRDYTASISYGKLHIPVYRVYAHPLTGVSAIPESSFTGRSNTLFALEIDVEVFGNNFLPAYTEGDNSNVVATDSMKNFVLRQALAFEGATIEALLDFLGRQFLQTYPQMETLRLMARTLPFAPVQVPEHAGSSFTESKVLFSRSHSDFSTVTLSFARDREQQPVVTAHCCGQQHLELFKITGSAFTHFVQDEYTTLPERVDRPLFIYLDLSWSYSDVEALLSADHTHYIPAEQVRDVVQVIFDEFVSESIQHLVYEIGCRLLDRFPQLAQVSFDAQNRTRDLVAASPHEERVKVYSDPFSAYGCIRLTLSRERV